jgi:periplasmic divalent cation tolerance protein
MRLAYVPIAPKETALALSRELVEARLVACANLLGPVTSTYRWEGNVEQGEEWLLLLKTTAERQSAVDAFLRERHPYDLPAILWLAPDSVHLPFAEWVRASVDS